MLTDKLAKLFSKRKSKNIQFYRGRLLNLRMRVVMVDVWPFDQSEASIQSKHSLTDVVLVALFDLVMSFHFDCARLQLSKMSCLCYFNRHSPANSSCYELPLQAWSRREKTAVSWCTAISLQWQQQQCWWWGWWLVTLSPTVIRRETLSTSSFLTACEYTPSINGHHIEYWWQGLIYNGEPDTSDFLLESFRSFILSLVS